MGLRLAPCGIALLLAVTCAEKLRTAPMDAHAAAASEYTPQGAMHFAPAAGDLFVPVLGDGIRRASSNRTTSSGPRPRERKLALLNAQCAPRAASSAFDPCAAHMNAKAHTTTAPRHRVAAVHRLPRCPDVLRFSIRANC